MTVLNLTIGLNRAVADMSLQEQQPDNQSQLASQTCLSKSMQPGNEEQDAAIENSILESAPPINEAGSKSFDLLYSETSILEQIPEEALQQSGLSKAVVAVDEDQTFEDSAEAYFQELAEQRSARKRGIIIVRCNRECQNAAAYDHLLKEYRERRDRRCKVKALTTEAAFVRFSSVTIHEHPMIIGDNPGCSFGPPLSISWKAQETLSLPLEEYELTRPSRRSHVQMVIPTSMRNAILRRAGYARNEIVELTKPVNIARNHRKRTIEVQNLDKIHEMSERILRATKHIVTLGYKKRQERKFLEPYVAYHSKCMARKGDLSNSTSSSTVALEASEELS
jgi:adenylate kinase family enzyme